MHTTKPCTRSARTVQRGQATTELLAAMLLIVPLFFGVIYMGKISDIKHQAIQASRYAALERAMDPAVRESDQVIKDETVARFFRDNGKFKDVRRADKASGGTDDMNANWKQADGKALLGQFSNVSVGLKAADTAASLKSSYVPLTNLEADKLFNKLPQEGVVQADVEVSLSKISHAAALAGLDIKVAATTVIAGNAWNAHGSQDVADHFPKSVISAVPARGASWLSKIPGINLLFKWTAGTDAPHPGCIKPEIVPDDVLAKNAKFDPSKTSGDNACL